MEIKFSPDNQVITVNYGNGQIFNYVFDPNYDQTKEKGNSDNPDQPTIESLVTRCIVPDYLLHNPEVGSKLSSDDILDIFSRDKRKRESKYPLDDHLHSLRKIKNWKDVNSSLIKNTTWVNEGNVSMAQSAVSLYHLLDHLPFEYKEKALEKINHYISVIYQF
jgi:hypothetical protein